MRVVALTVALILIQAGAAIAGCPTTPVAESGGAHWCYDAGAQGHVHLWKPLHFAADTAATVVYVHGHNLTAKGRQVRGKRAGVDGCVNAHYVDCVWDAHGLAAQFSKSGVNALFIAVEGPANAWQDVKWTSLDALLGSVAQSGGITPPGPVIALGHSAGMFTVVHFLNNVRLTHVVTLDSMYAKVPQRIESWLAAGRNRRLTLIGAEAQYGRTARLAGKIGCAGLDDATAACVTEIDAHLGHMDLVRDGNVIPRVLR